MRFLESLLLVAVAGALLPGVAAAKMHEGGGEHASLEQALVESADSPAAHQALARYYRGKAEQMQSLAEHHKAMARTYHGKMPQRRKMEKHCNELVTLYEKMKAEYEALAIEHDEASKK